jgi:hypothetical protein
MAQSSDILDLMSDLIKNDIQDQLKKIRPSRAFNGRRKPIGGGYVGAISNRVTSGTLFNSVTVQPTVLPDGTTTIEVSFPGADYWEWVNYGRRGKQDSSTVKYPPLSAIQSWISEKGLPQFRDRRGRFISNRNRLFLIQRSIGEYGIFPTMFVQEGYKMTEDRVVYYLGEYGKYLLTELLEQGRIFNQN